MNFFSVKRLVVTLILSVGCFITIPAYAWPDVDHMNMCGSPVKTVRAYSGNHQGWNSRDNFISTRGMAYYFRTMCPETKAVKMKKAAYKKPVIKKVSNEKKETVKVSKKEAGKEVVVKKTIEKNPIRAIKKRSTYNHKLDCERVDKLNGTGAIVRVVRRH